MPDKSSKCPSSVPSRQQQPTPSPPLNEQSPSTSAQPLNRSPMLMSGMRAAQSLAEWQLQAVLFRAKLTQYFDTFIAQGGDDIDQIMQCDETEFLEIMSLVGMASKPLHVRRLQRTLSEFSLNRAHFLISTVEFIGLPPIDFPCTSSTDNLTAALQFLIPGYLPGGPLDLCAMAQQQEDPSNFLFLAASASSKAAALGMPSTQNTLACAPSSQFSGVAQKTVGTAPSATAIPLPLSDSLLLSLVNQSAFPLQMASTSQQSHAQPKRPKLSFSPPSTPNNREREGAGRAEETAMVMLSGGSEAGSAGQPSERLTDAELLRLEQFAQQMIEQLPPRLEPRQGHSRRRPERGLLEAMSLSVDDPLRIEHFRLFARIYGRFDAKRRPDKVLTRHERIVNEAAAQLSLLRPELLTRRDELFPLARKLARLFEVPGTYRPAEESVGSPEERSCSAASSTIESTGGTPQQSDRGRDSSRVEDEEEEDGAEGGEAK